MEPAVIAEIRLLISRLDQRQRRCLSGYLAGVSNAPVAQPSSETCVTQSTVTVLYGSQSAGLVHMHLGASAGDERLNSLYKENIGEQQVVEILSPLIRRYATERQTGEGFGDFVIRIAVAKPMLVDRDFQRISATK